MDKETPPVGGMPVVAALPAGISAVEAFQRLNHLPQCLFLDSALPHPVLGRYSFVAVDPFDVIRGTGSASRDWPALQACLSRFQSQAVPELPPFQGGAAGYLSYDLGRQPESIPPPLYDEFALPTFTLGLYDVVLAFDHASRQGWCISHGFPEMEPVARAARARARLQAVLRMLDTPPQAPGEGVVSHAAVPHMHARPADALAEAELAPQFATGVSPGLTSNFSRAAYLKSVEKAIEYIRAGDAFQVNLAQRLLHPAVDHATQLFLRLRQRNPATFAGYFDAGSFQIVSASPERFLKLHAGQVEARPIKGTRPRFSNPEADLFSADELAQNEKDRAENVMIVDLLRNDLSRACLPESIAVSQLCGLEHYAFVWHLVSAIRGTLRPGLAAFDLLAAAFPCGSVTGAPKVRAMQIISELEPTARGAYCGALGYFGFDGAMDTSVLIRTITAARGWWQFPVGGGIVSQSHPQRELEETWHKAEGLLRALL